MKKIFSFFVVLASLFTLMILPAKAASTQFYNICSSLGETSTEMRINYHSNLESSTVYYGTNSSSLTSEATPDIKAWHYDKVGDDDATGFPERYICTVELTNLTLNTTYYYQIASGSEKSEVYSFTTASGSSTTFAWLTDTQSSGSLYGEVNTLFNTLKEKNKDISFVLTSGDNVDRGGYESQWNSFFQYLTFLKSTPISAIPGNHEYYLSKDAGYVEPIIFNQYFNNPKNGPVERLNSTYYFKYNDILFIMLDVMKADYATAQMKWFEEVCQNNPSKFIIVSSHRGVMNTGANKHDSQWMYQYWRPLFEKYAVDLVLNGHDHVFGYTAPLINGKKDVDNGVTYAVGPSAARKGTQMASNCTPNFEYNESIKNAGCIISVEGNTLTLRMMDMYGETNDNATFTIKSRRSSVSFNESSFKRSIKAEFNATAKEATLTWTGNIYSHITSIDVTSLTDGFKYPTKYVYTNKVNSFDLGNCYTNLNYAYFVVFHKSDGTDITKTVSIINNPDEPNPAIATVKFETLNGTKIKDVTMDKGELLAEPDRKLTKDGLVFKGWVLDGEYYDFNSPVIKDMTLTAHWTTKEYPDLAPDEALVVFDSKGGSKVETIVVKVGETIEYPGEATKNGASFNYWMLNGEEFDFETPITGTIVLEASWQTTGGAGCQMGTISGVLSTISLLGVVVLAFKRKQN